MSLLKDKATKTDWPGIVFQAEAEREWFDEVTVVTLKSHYHDKVYDVAWANADMVKESVDDTAKEIMKSGAITVREYIKIDDNYHVEVCVDRDKITDEVVEEALNKLIDIDIHSNLFMESGVERTFQPHEMWQHIEENK